MAELVSFKKIQLSALLCYLEQPKNNTDYICHAAEEIHRSNGELWWCDEMHTYLEFLRIMPEYIHAINDGGTLSNWVKNMPSHLRKKQYSSVNRPFRISFLRWAIKKFGDQEINFRFIGDGGVYECDE